MATRTTEEALIWASTATLSDWADLFEQRYGRRNLWINSSIRKRIILLQVAVRNVQETVRKKLLVTQVGMHLSHAFGWLMSIVNYAGNEFYGHPLAVFMAMKYPGGACVYCQRMPCTCESGSRALCQPRGEWSEKQLSRTLQQYQDQLYSCYGQKNKDRGIEWTILRLHSEVTEIGELLARCDVMPMDTGSFEQKLAFEICDVLAWLCAVAYCSDFSLEQAVATIYATKCPFCAGNVCHCGQAVLEKESFSTTATS